MRKIKTELEAGLTLRYGSDTPAISNNSGAEPADAVLAGLLAHKSARQYQAKPLPPSTLERLTAAAQSAATSSNLQTWSVIALQNVEHKARAAELCGDQDFIRQAPLFLVFCADLARLTLVSEQAGLPGGGLDYLEMFIMATIDASLAAQNVAVAAEAQGLGICYVGAARNKPRELAALLHLPPRVFALFGMTVGWPAEETAAVVKPRLPQPAVLHHETYVVETQSDNIARYNETARRFYESQGMTAQGDWSPRSARRVATAQSLTGRDTLRQWLQEHGFALK